MKYNIDIIVVYNEPETLANAFLTSAALTDANLVLVDNTVSGLPLPTIFNARKAESLADWIVFCHQDFVVFESDWLARIAALSDTACYGPIGISSTDGLVGRIRQTDGSFLGAPLDGADVVGLDEQCLIVPRRIYSMIDFDPTFKFDFYVHDFCLAVRGAGFAVKTLQLDCQHRSKNTIGSISGPQYLKAQTEYILKHSHQPPLLTTTFQWRPKYWADPELILGLRLQLSLIPNGSAVLEVGTAAGHMTRALQRKGCEVTGIEMSDDLANMAAPFARRLIVGNVEHLDLDTQIPEHFDVILCGDVLEHLTEPDVVLSNLKRRLTPNGFLVVSLPNVAHGSVRLDLLTGRFTYVREGLLDATHLRFFTLESLVDLFNNVGYEVSDLQRIRISLFDTEIRLDPAPFGSKVVRRLLEDPEAGTYQFVFRATPSQSRNDVVELRDRTFDAAREKADFAAYSLGKAWDAFHVHDDPIQARTWAGLSFCIAPTLKAALYWLYSFSPWRRRGHSAVARSGNQ